MNDVRLDRDRYVLGDPSAHVGILNCERISERSHIHGWKVDTHFHEGLSQLFLFSRGRVTGRIDYQLHQLQAPALIWLPALCNHGFDYEPDMHGWVITIPTAEVARITEERIWLREQIQQPRVLQGAENAACLTEAEHLTLRIEEEHRRHGEERSLALEALFLLLLLNLHRGLADKAAPAPVVTNRQQLLVRRFETLLDEQMRAPRSVTGLADTLSVTATHLSRTVKAVTGRTAGEIIQDRVLLEAKRQLVFTDHPIAEIAYALHFSSPSYFTRFFAARTKETPGSFRRRAR
tara:strand:+ start:670 stop:1545 length:876 start_codon:yes stop_codon:yes gene_type:complete